jgi:hypothetical protein
MHNNTVHFVPVRFRAARVYPSAGLVDSTMMALTIVGK